MAAFDPAPPVVEPYVLEDLRRRLDGMRRVELLPETGRSLGVDPAFFADLLAEWRDGYDWRPFEHRVRALPWSVVEQPGRSLRLVHRRAAAPEAPAVVLLHGWPDSVMRFERVLPELEAFHVVIPALPGYPFALPVTDRAMSAAEIGDAVAAAMGALGYARYLVSGGDVGTDVAEGIAWRHPASVAGLHLTDVAHHHALVDPPTDLQPEEQAYLRRVHAWHAEDGGYNHEQSTRPNTLAIALGDSPAGLLAWIVEKLRSWSDRDAFTTTEVLDWVTAYWATGAIGTSFAPYARRSEIGRPPAPTAFTLFPRDIVSAPRRFAERFFDVRSWRVASGGGHFDAWERPLDYAEGVRAASRAGGLSGTPSA